jgi:hypothetical protein
MGIMVLVTLPATQEPEEEEEVLQLPEPLQQVEFVQVLMQPEVPELTREVQEHIIQIVALLPILQA